MKWKYGGSDFEELDFSGASMHAISFSKAEDGIRIDIDYVYESRCMQEDDKRWFEFLVAPATLVFPYAYGIEMELEAYEGWVELEGITRSSTCQFMGEDGISRPKWDWLVGFTPAGELRFKSVDFGLIVRSVPEWRPMYALDSGTRGGCSFEISGTQDNSPG